MILYRNKTRQSRSVFRFHTGRSLMSVMAVFAMIAAGSIAVYRFRHPPPPAPMPSRLAQIIQRNELRVVTRNNANCYYEYRNQPMGFEYDLAKAFADRLGVRLVVIVADQWEGLLPAVLNGSADIVAANMTATPKRKSQVAFSKGYLQIRQQIITHRNNNSVSSMADLEGRTVHVRRGTSYQERLEVLNSAGIGIRIKLVPDIPTEELIRQVADGQIEITVADSHIALLNRRYYPKAVMAAPLGGPEMIGWAVHPEAIALLNRINAFFDEIKTNGRFDRIQARYFSNVEQFDFVDLNAFHRRLKTRLPRYMKTIRSASDDAGMDWRKIAAQMYQESHFRPRARSRANAHGLMQLTHPIARAYGVKSIYDPNQNIRAGVRMMKDLVAHFDKAVFPDRWYLALAAYNVGIGHVQDARDLARQRNLDPNRWASLKETLPLLRFRKYYKHARYGYCRGTEPVAYIRQILVYYDILKRKGVQFQYNGSERAEGS